MEAFDDLTLLLLTWNNPNLCKRAVDNWEKHMPFITHKIAYVNGKNSAYDFLPDAGYTVLGDERNVGIALAMGALITNCKTEYALFLEHDWFITPPAAPVVELLSAKAILRSGEVDVVRLRHKSNPGDPVYSSHFGNSILRERPEHILDAAHWNTEDLDKVFPEQITAKRAYYDKFFCTTSKYGAYTNNPCMYRTEFLV